MRKKKYGLAFLLRVQEHLAWDLGYYLARGNNDEYMNTLAAMTVVENAFARAIGLDAHDTVICASTRLAH